jgi:hypothetical protein
MNLVQILLIIGIINMNKEYWHKRIFCSCGWNVEGTLEYGGTGDFHYFNVCPKCGAEVPKVSLHFYKKELGQFTEKIVRQVNGKWEYK